MDENRDNRSNTGAEGGGPTAYSDAYYRAAPETRRSCYGYSPAQCYARVSEQETASSGRQSGLSYRSASFALIFAVCLVAFCLLFIGGVILNYRANAAGRHDTGSAELYEEATEELASEPSESALPLVRNSIEGSVMMSAEEIYSVACSSSVGVTVPGYAYNIFGQPDANAVTGTGIVLSEDGYILTNYHVIQTAYERGLPILVLTFDGEEHAASVVGIEMDSDLAVLKAEAEGLTAAVIGDSDEIRVGQTIYTIGNPLGALTYTMTSGIVSALGRRITTDEDVTVNMFQVDAAINNGSSGGPVYNVYGQVIGVVTAKYSQYGMEGLGFAIPINDACRIAEDLVGKGYVSGKAYLGMSFADVSPSVARYYDMVQGVYICSVEKDSCSEAAGLIPGDIIIAIDGAPVRDSAELVQAVRQYNAGDSAELTVWRSKATLTVTVVFDEELPSEPAGEDASAESAADDDPTGEIVES